MHLPARNEPLWKRAASASYPSLSGRHEADVVVVGGGIAGLTTALLLARAAKSVIVVEAREIGSGTSGHTTAKASALQGTKYQRITEHHGVGAAQDYASAQLDALAWMDDHVASSAFDCRWDARPAFSFATTDDGKRRIEAELVAAARAGLAVERLEPDLPFPSTAAVGLADQAQFDPQAYLDALAAQVDALSSGRVFEHSRVTAVRGLRRHEVVTDQATIRCGAVVVATLMPIVDRGLFFARSEPKSSYLVALRANGPLPHGMYLSADDPSRSLRTAPGPGGEVLLVGGQGHPTGDGAPTLARYQELANWAAIHFPVDAVISRWSAHDVVPADHLPWVGASSPLTPNVLVASGFDKWGMTMGTAAALVLADRLTGDDDGRTAPWARTFDPGRLSPRGLVKAAKLNAGIGARLVSDWVHPQADPGADGRGARHRGGLVPVGDSGPASEEVDVVCTHLGGVCSWNDGEATWDCPLHGSRFLVDGSVLAGPATRPLHVGRRRRTAPAAPVELRPPSAATSSGYLVTDRQDLLTRLAVGGILPAHPQVIADHVTYRADDPDPAPVAAVFTATAFVRTDAVDAVVGSVDGEAVRPDGRRFHITLSVASGHHPVESNAAIEHGPVEPIEPAFEVPLARF